MPNTIAIVTPTYNRKRLLMRLYESLETQGTNDFLWIVVDDCSPDDTAATVKSLAERSTFPIRLIRNSRNAGKGASLNRAFDEKNVDFFLVVDSDDYLLPHAMRGVQEKVSEYRHAPDVGAIFFEYQLPDGDRLRPYSADRDLLMSRLDHDARYAKYDGCVGYYKETVERHRYPEYQHENYIGPTVLQMLMLPKKIVFTPHVVGVAEYQEGGLTQSGRRLRVRNPQGMRLYSALKFVYSPRVRSRWLQAILFESYNQLIDAERAEQHPTIAQVEADAPAGTRLLGRILAIRWKALAR